MLHYMFLTLRMDGARPKGGTSLLLCDEKFLFCGGQSKNSMKKCKRVEEDVREIQGCRGT